MRKINYLFITLALLYASCQKDLHNSNSASVATAQQQQESVMSKDQMNDIIKNKFEQTGSFNWSDASDMMLWSAGKQSDKIFSVGYAPAGTGNIDNTIASININDQKWKDAKQQVLQVIYYAELEKNPSLKMEDLEVWKDKKLPVIDVKIESLKTIKLLRQNNLVRYVDPMGYDPLATLTNEGFSIFDGSGCGGYTGDNSLVEGSDYTTITPGTKASWNYSYHGIQNAWTKSTGAGITVMVIDTGVDPSQDNLGSQFNQGQSSGRTITKIFTLAGATSANDGCGHGTTMSGEVAAPRGTDGNSCGVAYNCNFVICRAAKDVYIDESSELKGVSDAYTWGADNADVKIISLSLGRLTGNSQIKDAINYAYGKGKLMFCAGGTSFSWAAGFVGVIFPASLSNVQAITGVTDATTFNACSDCHKGKQIDFVIVMEKASDKHHPISTAISGDVPTTVGGSSVATATAAGIAALVWSKNPTFTRDNVINKLTTTASGYPKKDANYGWGKMNADAATN